MDLGGLIERHQFVFRDMRFSAQWFFLMSRREILSSPQTRWAGAVVTSWSPAANREHRPA
jgi:hypothetical protein